MAGHQAHRHSRVWFPVGPDRDRLARAKHPEYGGGNMSEILVNLIIQAIGGMRS
jgi:hypothetical protein